MKTTLLLLAFLARTIQTIRVLRMEETDEIPKPKGRRRYE